MAKKPAKTKAKSPPKKAAPKVKPAAKKAVVKAKPAAKTKPAPKAKAEPKKVAPPAEKKVAKKAIEKDLAKAPAKADKNLKPKKTAVPSVMGSKPKKDADDLEDEFLDDDIEIDPELAEFVEDVAELEQADAEAEKAIAGEATEDEEEVAAPAKKTPKEKSATERRMKKERDLLSGIDRNGDLSEIWQKFYDAHKTEKAKSYSMREVFEPKSPLQHVKLGWGYILSNINDRLEVLFKDGIKILISNYKS